MSNVLIEGRFVVCAACKYGDLILAGARHFSPAMQSQMDKIKEDGLIDMDNLGRAEQGFLDQYDVFMSREEAYEVALHAGQLNTRRSKSGSKNSKTLFSEDLY